MMNQIEEKIKFSVVLPIYNVEKYLNRCLDSVMNQTYKKLEIILVDDGSPDSCPQMCDNWDKMLMIVLRLYIKKKCWSG